MGGSPRTQCEHVVYLRQGRYRWSLVEPYHQSPVEGKRILPGWRCRLDAGHRYPCGTRIEQHRDIAERCDLDCIEGLRRKTLPILSLVRFSPLTKPAGILNFVL